MYRQYLKCIFRIKFVIYKLTSFIHSLVLYFHISSTSNWCCESKLLLQHDARVFWGMLNQIFTMIWLILHGSMSSIPLNQKVFIKNIHTTIYIRPFTSTTVPANNVNTQFSFTGNYWSLNFLLFFTLLQLHNGVCLHWSKQKQKILRISEQVNWTQNGRQRVRR